MMEAEQIAARLSKEQRAAVIHIPERRLKMPQRWMSLVGYDFERLGLMTRSFMLDKSQITPLGLAVRAAIERKPHDH